MAMKMSQIKKCDAQECAYNKERQCHALAITVGDSRSQSQSHPMCDTFTAMSQEAGDANTTGFVGACRAADCEYNGNLQCQAGQIDVGAHKQMDWDCQTYEKRSQQSSSKGKQKEAW